MFSPSESSTGLVPLILGDYVGNLSSDSVSDLLDAERPFKVWSKPHFTGASPQMMHG